MPRIARDIIRPARCERHIFIRNKANALDNEGRVRARLQPVGDRISLQIDTNPYRLVRSRENIDPEKYEIQEPSTLKAAVLFALEHNIDAPCLKTAYSIQGRKISGIAIGDPKTTPGLKLALEQSEAQGLEVMPFKLQIKA